MHVGGVPVSSTAIKRNLGLEYSLHSMMEVGEHCKIGSPVRVSIWCERTHRHVNATISFLATAQAPELMSSVEQEVSST